MRRCAKFLLLGCSWLVVPLGLQSQNNPASSLSCWEGKTHTSFQSRQEKTPVAKSNGGFAYAEVFAEASTISEIGQLCTNKAKLFYSQTGSDYKLVYEKDGLEDQGVGMRVLGWSHTGKQLLIELTVWGYDSEGDPSRSALVFDSTAGQIKELPLSDAFERVLGKDCEYDSTLAGWGANDHVLVRVTKTPATSRYEQTFCVEKPTVYNFNMQDGTMQKGAK